MALPTPQLDDRKFRELVEEAKQRIPRYTPEWTNFNDSDPGMTLVKLHAWLTETILYRLNKLPDLTYIKFLELLNIQPKPAVAAAAELTFTLKKLDKPSDPLLALIPKNTQVGVDDPDLEGELIFETDRTLTAINAILAVVIAPDSDNSRKVVTEYDAENVATTIPHPFYPFGEDPTATSEPICWLGILVRPNRKAGENYALDRFPAGELDLTTYVPQVLEQTVPLQSNGDTFKQIIAGPQAIECLFPWQVAQQAATITWEAYHGTEHEVQFTNVGNSTIWRPLSVHDDTAALGRSGHLFLDVPGGLPAVPFASLSRAFWQTLDLEKPPTTVDELATDIEAGRTITYDVYDSLGAEAMPLAQLLPLLTDPLANQPEIVSILRNHAAELNLRQATAVSLADDIEDGTLPPEEVADTVWSTLGFTSVVPASLEDFIDNLFADRAILADIVRRNAAAFTFSEENVSEEDWVEQRYDAAPAPHGLTWFRARWTGADSTKSPIVSQFLLNTVSATAAVTRFEEVVGTSNGNPNQTFQLSRTPVLVVAENDRLVPDVILTVRVEDEEKEWTAVSDFYQPEPGPEADPVADPADIGTIYLLDPTSGQISFGDGLRGQIPVAGARIIVTRYRYGGGSVGNAGPGTITALKSSVRHVANVTNVRAASGGGDAETLDDARLRAPHDLRHRERAVTVADFADLASETPGVRIQRAYALAQMKADSATDPATLIPNQAGAVTVVILPENTAVSDDNLPPQPSEDQLALVCDYLNNRRLITTELYVVGPPYLTLTGLEAELLVSQQADLKTVHEAAYTKLQTYFDPLKGGEDGQGWPFGRNIYHGNVYRQLLEIDHVLRVVCLEITPADSTAICDDEIEVPDGALVHLPAATINVQVNYDLRGQR